MGLKRRYNGLELLNNAIPRPAPFGAGHFFSTLFKENPWKRLVFGRRLCYNDSTVRRPAGILSCGIFLECLPIGIISVFCGDAPKTKAGFRMIGRLLIAMLPLTHERVRPTKKELF